MSYHVPPFNFSDTAERNIYTVVAPSNFYNLSPLELSRKYKMNVQPTPMPTPAPSVLTPSIPSIPASLIPPSNPSVKTVDANEVKDVYNKLLTFYEPNSYFDEEKKRLEITLQQLKDLYENPYNPSGKEILKVAKDYLADLTDERDRGKTEPIKPKPEPTPDLPPSRGEKPEPKPLPKPETGGSSGNHLPIVEDPIDWWKPRF